MQSAADAAAAAAAVDDVSASRRWPVRGIGVRTIRTPLLFSTNGSTIHTQ